MQANIYISVQTQDIDILQQTLALRGHPSSTGKAGAIVSFIGLMRDINPVAGVTAHVSSMSLEHYPGMTELSLDTIAKQAMVRFDLLGVRVLHRVGEFKPDDVIVWVGVSAAHRLAAFEGCEYVMDFLKTRAPFWKKEHTDLGSRWVDARQSDTHAVDRWA